MSAETEVQEKLDGVIDACRDFANVLCKWRGHITSVPPDVAFYAGTLLGVLAAHEVGKREKERE